MIWEIDNQDGGYRQLSIEVPWEDVAEDYEDLLQEYGRLRVPGFRPGKVPREILEQRFHREISETLAQRCTPRLCRRALEQAEAEAAGPAEVSEVKWEEGRLFRFKMCFFPLPEFDLPDYRSLKVKEGSADPQGELSLRLLDLVDFQVPDGLVRAELAFDGLAEIEPGSAAWQAAAQRVKLMLILKRLARIEGIEVEEAEVDRRIEEKAKEFGVKVNALRADLEKTGGRPRLKDLLLAENVLGYLLEMSAAS